MVSVEHEHSGGAPLSALLRLLHRHGTAIGALLVRVVAAGLAYVAQIILARTLGADEYGAFAWAWAWVSIAGFAGTFGFSQTAVRFLARYSETGDAAAATGFIRMGYAVIGASAALAALLGVCAVMLLPEWRGTALFLPAAIALATFPLFALGDLAEGFARSQGWSLLALAPPYILRQVLLVAAMAGLYGAGITPDATLAMTAAFAATTITALLQLRLVLRRFATRALTAPDATYDTGTWFAAAWPVFLSDTAQVLRQNIDVLLLALFVSPGEIALYFAATRVASLLGLVEFAVGAAAAHRFARLGENDPADALARMARQAATLTFWPTLIAGIGVALVAPYVLALFGRDYIASAPLVMMLTAGYVLRAAIGPAEELLMMRDQGHGLLGAQVAGLAIAAMACLLLIPAFGTTGAAAGMTAGLVGATATLAFYCWKRLGVLPLPLPLRGGTPA